ncbi:MAG: hypothetical protein HZA50_17430 [Planctomycetes bacterium]|nr:hypothetical protein [Planctomycetota bacterium]
MNQPDQNPPQENPSQPDRQDEILERNISEMLKDCPRQQEPAPEFVNKLKAEMTQAAAGKRKFFGRVRQWRWTSVRWWALAASILIVNVVGLLWLRYDMTHTYKPKLRVLSALPTQNIEKTDRLVLIFDEAIAAVSLLNQPLERAPFILYPLVAGRWQWSASDRLEYLLDRPLKPGMFYSIKPSPDIEVQTGRKLIGSAEFQFATSPLALQSCNLGLVERDNVNLEFVFSQPVRPDDLLRNLVIYDTKTGTDLRPACLVRKADARPVVRVMRPSSDQMSITVKAGLTGDGANRGLANGSNFNINVPTRLALTNAYVREPSIRKNITVDLQFTRPLDPNQPSPAVAIDPPVTGVRITIDSSGSTGQLRLTGPFECGRRYKATVDAELRANDDSTLGSRQFVSFDIPERTPRVAFPVSTGAISPMGNLCVDLDVVNIARLQISACKIHPNNLVSFLQHASEELSGRQLAEKTVPVNLPRNQPGRVAVDLGGLFEGGKGVYRMHVRNAQGWPGDSAFICVTDIALTAKRQRDGYTVWATSLAAARPLEGVIVEGFTRNNQVIAQARTDSSGLAFLPAVSGHPDGPIWLIAARTDSDFSFIRPQEHPWVFDDADISGRKAPESCDVMIYSDRGIYRPGQTIQITGIVRDRDGNLPPALPLSVGVTRPDGRKVADLPIRLPAVSQGFFHAEFTPPDDCQTGLYSFNVALAGGGETLGRMQAMVEDFVPIRIEVKAQPAKPSFGPGEQPRVAVNADYLFGRPAAGLRAKITGTISPAPFRPKAFAGYQFGADYDLPTQSMHSTEVFLDDKGKADINLDLPDKLRPGFYRVQACATVTEMGGRSVSAATAFTVDTAGRHVGVMLPEGRIVQTDQPVSARWGQVDGAGKQAEGGPVEWSLWLIEWDWVAQETPRGDADEYAVRSNRHGGSNVVWKYVKREVRIDGGMLEGPAVQAAGGELSIKCPQDGQYLLRMKDKQSGATTVAELHAATEGGRLQSGAISRADRVQIVLDKRQYDWADKAGILVRSPFDGLMLLTVESDRVLESRVIEIRGGQARVDYAVPDNLRGGAFVTATVVRPIDFGRDKWLPQRANGVARLKVSPERQRLAVSIDSPQLVLPGQNVKITVRSDQPMYPQLPPVAHVWAVDEGILLTANYRTPDPLEYFLGQRRLDVASADLYDKLMPDYKRPQDIEKIGAGGPSDDDARSIRSSPVSIRTARPAIVWMRSVPMGSDGVAELDMSLPDYNGRLRIMAVVADFDCYGRADKSLTLQSPITVEASWPRFAAPGDLARVPLKLFNNTGAGATAAVRLDVEGPVAINRADEKKPADSGDALIRGICMATMPANMPAEVQTGPRAVGLGEINLDAGQSKIIWLDVQAFAPGEVRIVASAVSGAGGGRQESVFTVRPAGVPDSECKFFCVEAGKRLDLDPFERFLPNLSKLKINVGPAPAVQLRPAVERLVQYPFGCAEQTTSKLTGMLYAPQVLEMDCPGDASAQYARGMIQAGIMRLWSMQTEDGGIAYWPGESHSALWPSIYAANFLALAGRQNYKVDKRMLDDMAGYLAKELERQRDLNDNMRAFVCLALARLGKPPHGWISRLSDNLNKLDIAGRADVAACWLELGRRDLAVKALPEDTPGLAVPTVTSDRFTSKLAQQGRLLEVLMDLDPEHLWIKPLVEQIDKGRQQYGYWGTTLENASCIAALSRYMTAGKAEKPDFLGAILQGDKRLGRFNHQAPALIKIDDATQPVRIESQGTGKIYVSVTAEGQLKQGLFKPYDRNLSVRRAWVDRAGKPIDLAKLKVGDLVMVEVTLATKGGSSVHNVAVVDVLPGCMEVENPALATSEYGRTPSASAGHTEFLDDRVLIFTSAGSNELKFKYALRVISAGRFQAPPIQASCMYDPQFASVNSGNQTIEVSED